MLATQTPSGEKETILNKGDLAPFYGVVMPEEQYRFYKKNQKICEYQLHDPMESDCEAMSPEGKLLWFLSGTLIGGASALLLKR